MTDAQRVRNNTTSRKLSHDLCVVTGSSGSPWWFLGLFPHVLPALDNEGLIFFRRRGSKELWYCLSTHIREALHNNSLVLIIPVNNYNRSQVKKIREDSLRQLCDRGYFQVKIEEKLTNSNDGSPHFRVTENMCGIKKNEVKIRKSRPKGQ